MELTDGMAGAQALAIGRTFTLGVESWSNAWLGLFSNGRSPSFTSHTIGFQLRVVNEWPHQLRRRELAAC
jgi:hypothetical protein